MTTQTQNKSIPLDIHHHMLPSFYRQALRERGFDSQQIPSWTPGDSLAMMDHVGIQKALLSVASPGTWFGDDEAACTLSRSCNEYAAELTRERPDRFGALGSLPFPDLEGSIKELEYVLDRLKFDGVILLTNVSGQYIGDPEFETLLEELDRRKAMVLLHPNDLPSSDENAPLHAWTEYPVDVVRAFARLMLNDYMVVYPNIRWTLSHGGGALPFLADRVGKLHYVRGKQILWGRIFKDLFAKRNGGLDLAKSLSYDSVGTGHPAAQASLNQLVKTEQIYFGSDFPWNSSLTASANPSTPAAK